ncbi:MAG: DEAD/DEAH box helicase family protein [Bacteroidales bacterium]|jgi:superfamily II DNA or RNA helicase|nr:DEAD/DEAH box helicase family protein [Bacteroidales bacterium]
MTPLETYQQEAIGYIIDNWNKSINSLCALGVGMGKTRVACEILSKYLKVDAQKRLKGYALVCCNTRNVRDTIWANTLNDFDLSMKILEGHSFEIIKMKNTKTLTIPPLTVCLITYANLYREETLEYFINSPPNLIIFDEYHILTNNAIKKSQSYREAILKLPIQLRLGLTATPLVNDEMESVLAYGLLNDANLVRKFQKSNTGERKDLIKKITQKHFMFYKDNEYNGTPVSELIISIPMEKVHYDDYLKIEEYDDISNKNKEHQALRLSISPCLVDKGLKLDVHNNITTGKIIALKTIITNLPKDDKMVIFDTYQNTLKHIKQLDFIRPLKPLLYIGGTGSQNQKNYKLFSEDPEHRVLLATRQAGGEGINLQAANHLVILNVWYTVKDLIQILGRIKRKGQNKPVYSYIFAYNLFDVIDLRYLRDNPKLYFLKEEYNFYNAIGKKTGMNEEWGIEVKNKMPNVVCFKKSSTFEVEFNNFVKSIITPEKLAIESDIEKTAEKEEADYRDRVYKMEYEMGQTIMDYIISQMYYHSLMDDLNNIELKI